MSQHTAPDTRATAFQEAEAAYQQAHMGNPTYGDKRGKHYATMSAWAEARRSWMTPDTIRANERLHSRMAAASA